MGVLNSTKKQQHNNGQIRKICKLPCPDLCKNTHLPITEEVGGYTKWEFYDGNDEDNEWHLDDSMSLQCISKGKILGNILRDHRYLLVSLVQIF